MNNDTSNIIILSPSYHRIIHKAKPMFDRPSLSFHFSNGLVEKMNRVIQDRLFSSDSDKLTGGQLPELPFDDD